MSDTIDVTASSVVDQALAQSARAAAAWCARSGEGALDGKRLIEHLMRAASWVSRARRDHKLSTLGIAQLVDNFSQPVDTWLPSADSLLLVKDGQPTAECEIIREELGESPANVEQMVIRDAMNHIMDQDDKEAIYVAFRRYLVEHASADHAEAVAALLPAGLELAKVYQKVAANARKYSRGQDVFYPCPRCRWPMRVQGDKVSCHLSPACIEEGARFKLGNDGLVGLGKLPPPSPVPAEGAVALLSGIWRFTVLPGLEELRLEGRLRKIQGAHVRLWPFVDAYDLDVLRGDHHWRIDVKDYSWTSSLARHLRNKPQDRFVTWIVVPNSRKEQVPRLRRLLPDREDYEFAYADEFVRLVKNTI